MNDQLHDWIDVNKLDKEELSSNPSAIYYLLSHSEHINWKGLSRNPHPVAIKLLKENLSNVYWSSLCLNHSQEAVDLLETYLDKLDISQWSRLLNGWEWKWNSLSYNTYAVSLLEKYPKLIDWDKLSRNTNAKNLIESNREKCTNIYGNPCVIHLYQHSQIPDKYYHSYLMNPSAFPTLLEEPKLIVWAELACNSNSNILSFLTNYARENNPLSQYFWRNVAKNPNLLALIEQYIQKTPIKQINTEIWMSLAGNKTKKSIELIEKYLPYLSERKIRNIWKHMSKNPYAIKLLSTKPDLVSYPLLSSNHGLFGDAF